MWLRVTVDGGYVQFNWGINSHGRQLPYDDSFKVSKALIDRASTRVQDSLTRLTKWSMSKSPDPARLPELLKGIASAGQALKFTLFRDPGKESQIDELKRWIADVYSGGDRELRVYEHPDIHVPWGLVFDGNVASIPDNAADRASFDQFWALRYRLSSPMSACEQPPRSVNRERFRMLSLVDEGVHRHARNDLGARYSVLEQLLGHPAGTINDWDRYPDKKSEIEGMNVLLYFFGHQSNGSLELGPQSKDVLDFTMMMDELTQLKGRADAERSCNLVFLNACDSAKGAAEYSFRAGVARPGFCGLIATEAVVPRIFAQKFACRLLESIVSERRSVGETMESLRNDDAFWPLSLLYGCYAFPEFRIAA